MTRNAGIPAADATASNAIRQYPGSATDAAGACDDTPMTIREVAHQFGMTPRALRFYEAKRLIRRSAAAQRGFTAAATASASR
jgi:hypothetical protein